MIRKAIQIYNRDPKWFHRELLKFVMFLCALWFFLLMATT